MKMQNPTPIDRQHLMLASHMTEQLCHLPAVETLDWCDRAAGSLTSLRRRCLVSVSIAEMDAKGALIALEATGAAASGFDASAITLLRKRFDSDSGFGWVLGDSLNPSAPRTITFDLVTNGSSTRSRSAWRQSGCDRVSVTACPMGLSMSRRTVVIECAAHSDDRPLDTAETELLSTMLAPITHRALFAFGDARSSRLPITLREQLVLEHLTVGRSVKQIAEELSRSPHTVHDHIKSLHRKLNASSRGELIARALGLQAEANRTAHVQKRSPALLSA